MKRLIRLCSILFLLVLSPALFAQSQLTEHTLKLDDPANMPKASIEGLAWLAGRWLGEGFGGALEETWNPPLGGTMMATFRLVTEGQPGFYEICLIVPEGNSLVYKVKHFNPDLTGWEEKDDYVTFPLVKLEPNAAYFNGLTMKLEGNTCQLYLAMKQEDGSYEEAGLVYHRASATATPESQDVLSQFQWAGKKIPLVLLGSYHMSNPGADQFNLESDDVLTPKRQAEIEAVVKRLAAFKPTKIAVEAPYGDSATIARYQEYLAGKRELRRSEEEQIGFRLAKMLGHKTIYPIDVRMDIWPPALEQAIAANPAEHGPRMAEMDQLGKAAITQMGQWLKEGTIADMLYEMNRPEFLDLAYQLYLRIFLPTVEGDNYAGADLVAAWYQRNLRIMSNLHQIGLTPEDRVLVVYGQGHVPLFERIAEDSPYFEVVSVLPYLR
ncbi:MAG: hypothetical protein KDD19_10010 [Phaeodactylibacter sp.]|nr:hypothetical protein [Phaeodactylibacter sp.]MCB9051289.1 hypothetical protein [Lewinellaceae bacterium]